MLINDHHFELLLVGFITGVRATVNDLTQTPAFDSLARRPHGIPIYKEGRMHMQMRPSMRLYFASDDEVDAIRSIFDAYVHDSGHYRFAFADPAWNAAGTALVLDAADGKGQAYPHM